MNVLLDTGILLRLLDSADPAHARIRRAIRVRHANGNVLVSAPQNVAEFWNVCTRPTSSRGGYGLSVEETDRRLRLIERLFRILPDSADAYGHWRRLVTDCAVKGVQVHDARLVGFMLAHGIAHVLTLNAADFARYPGVIASTPENVPSA